MPMLDRWKDKMLTARGLGVYLLVLACCQIVLYLVWSVGEGPIWLVNFDPRIGLSFIESTLRDVDPAGPGTLCWYSSAILLVVAVIMCLTRRGVRLYVAVESVLAAPSIIFFARIFIIQVVPSYGMVVAELELPTSVFLVFTVLPVGLALRILAGSPEDLSILPGAAPLAVASAGSVEPAGGEAKPIDA